MDRNPLLVVVAPVKSNDVSCRRLYIDWAARADKQAATEAALIRRVRESFLRQTAFEPSSDCHSSRCVSAERTNVYVPLEQMQVFGSTTPGGTVGKQSRLRCSTSGNERYTKCQVYDSDLLTVSGRSFFDGYLPPAA